jgi:hypothetical protein
MKRNRLALSALALLCLVSAGVRAATDDQKLTGDEIVAKHLAAVGGREALAKIKTRVAVGTVQKESEPEGKLAIMSESPNRLSVFYGFRDFDLRMIYSGTQVSIRPDFTSRQVGNLAEKYREIVASGLMFNSISLYNLLATGAPNELKLEAKGIKKVGGRPAYVVELRRGKESPARLYFDAETFMWVRTDYGKASVSKEMGAFTNDVVNQSAGEATIDFYIETSDFRVVDGVKLPFKFQQVMTSPIMREKSVGTITGSIREYQHNVKIDPGMFR